MKDNNKKLGTAEIIILIIAAFGLIIMIADISEAIDETKRERAEQDRWYYEHIQKGADEYNRNHSNNTYNYSSSSKKSSSSSSSTTKNKSIKIKSSTSSKSSSSKVSSTTKTVDPMDHDIDAYYEDYKDEFEDEDDAWDDFEDNDEYWDDY